MQLVAAKAGSTVISAQVGGVTRSVVASVVSDSTLTGLSLSNRVLVGAIDGDRDLRRDVGVFPGEGAVTIPANGSSISTAVQGLMQGTTTLSVTYGGVTRSLIFTVVNQPVITYSISGGANISSDAILASDTPITINNDNPSVLAAPSMVVIPTAENAFSGIALKGLAAGTSSVNLHLTTQPSPSPAPTTVTVTP